MTTLQLIKKVVKMNQHILIQKITEAQLAGQTNLVYYEDGIRIELKLQVPTPRTPDMMYWV